MEKDKHLGLRIDSETHGKLKSLAEFEGRSINGEVLYLIRQAIAQHEKDHGTVTCSHHLNLTILKWGLPARLPFKAKLKQAIPACPAVLFFIFIRLRIFFLCR